MAHAIPSRTDAAASLSAWAETRREEERADPGAFDDAKRARTGLLADAAALLSAPPALSDASREVLRRHLRQTAGMSTWAERNAAIEADLKP